jgi:DNA polymerase-3 subunit delta
LVIFLYGPDGYRLKQNSRIVLENYGKKHPGGVFLKFDLSDTKEVEKVEDAVKSGSLFGGVRLIVIKNVFSNKSCSDRMVELIKTQNLLKEKGIVLMFVENQEEKELIKNQALFKLLTEKENMIKNIKYLEGEGLRKWVKNEFTLRGSLIEADAIRELIAITGNESWDLVNEIEKLCNFSVEDGRVNGIVTKKDITLLCCKKIDLNIFDFVDAIAGKNKSRAYEMLFKEIKNGRDPYYLLTMIVYGFRGLLSIKDLSDRRVSLDSMIKKTRLHPFVVKKTYQSSGKFNLGELKNIYRRLLEIDTYSKEGTLNLTDSLFSFVLN